MPWGEHNPSHLVLQDGAVGDSYPNTIAPSTQKQGALLWGQRSPLTAKWPSEHQVWLFLSRESGEIILKCDILHNNWKRMENFL